MQYKAEQLYRQGKVVSIDDDGGCALLPMLLYKDISSWPPTHPSADENDDDIGLFIFTHMFTLSMGHGSESQKFRDIHAVKCSGKA